MVATQKLKEAEAEIKRLNEELEQRVAERTRELAAANKESHEEIGERSRAEAVRREKQYESLVQSIDGIVWEVDDLQSFGFTFVSRQAERLLGYPLEQWLDDPNFWIEHLHPDDREWVVDFCIQSSAKRMPYQFEYRMIADDGRVIWLRDIVTVNIKDDDSVGLSGVMVNITESKQAEELNRTLLHDLAERVKELTALHKAARVLQQEGLDIPAMLGELVALLPTTFQYPAITAARIRLGQIEAVTPNFVESPTVLQTGFTTLAGQPVSIEVVYTEDPPPEAIEPFLVEERTLLDTLADMLRTFYDRRWAETALRESEERYRTLVKASSLVVWTSVDAEGLDYRMPGWVGLTGQTEAEAFGDGWLRMIHPDDREQAEQAWAEGRRTQTIYETEYRLRANDGSYHHVTSRGVPIVREGRVREWVGAIYDVTERRLAEEKLRQSERQLAEAQRIACIGSWNYELQSKTVIASAELYRIYGLPPREIDTLETFWKRIPPPEQELVEATLNHSLKLREPFNYYHRIIRADGALRTLHVRGDVLSDAHDGHPVRILGIAQDVTERKLAEAQLKNSNEQLRALSASLQSAREAEGTRIAREIHDELGSTLTGLRWELESIDKLISAPGKETQPGQLREKVAGMLSLTDTTISSVRRIASSLRPSVLDDLGLREAIEWETQKFQMRTDIICHCVYPPEEINLGQEQSTAVFRILQEALTNILRHARASKIEIRMSAEQSGALVLTISDNGRGITEDEKSGAHSLGLLGMRERAHLVGANIEIKGVAGKGTTVTVRVPNPRHGA